MHAHTQPYMKSCTCAHGRTHSITCTHTTVRTDTALHVDTAVHRDMSTYIWLVTDTQLQRPTTALYVDRETHSFPLEHTPTHRQLYTHSLYGQALSDGSKQPGSHPCSTTALKTLRTAAHAESHHHPHTDSHALDHCHLTHPRLHIKTESTCAPAHVRVHRHWQGCPHRLGRRPGSAPEPWTQRRPSVAGKGGGRAPEGQLSRPLSRLACSPEAWGRPWGCCNGGAAVKESYTGGAKGLQVPHPTPAQGSRAPSSSQVGGAPAHSGPICTGLPKGEQTHSTNPGETKKIIFFLFRVPEAQHESE